MFKSVILIPLLLITLCCNKAPKHPQVAIPELPPVFLKGADVSWVTQMEAAGKKFYDSAGKETELMQLLKNTGMNIIRLRVWVNPQNGWNGTDDVVAKAVRAKALGFKLMIDFHYSDTWADPGKQTRPVAWDGQDFATLRQSVAAHTTVVLNALKAKGITPEFVQVGNETNDGMLWPDGKASANMSNFAQLINAGYDAVKSVDSSILVIVHLSNGFDNSMYRWLFDGLKNNGGKWDVIGMSLYPTAGNWAMRNTQCLTNMDDMVMRYGKPVIVCEVGMPWDEPATCKSFLSDLIAKVKSVKDHKGIGVLYWEPESYQQWQGYTLGAFDNDGKPTIALDAFKE